MLYLLSFSAHEFIQFRELEVRSLFALNYLPLSCLTGDVDWNDSYILVELANDQEARKLIERSVLIKYVYAVWCSADTFDELCLKVPNIPENLVKDYISGPESIKFIVSSVHRKTSQAERLAYIKKIFNVQKDIIAPVSLSSPTHVLNLLFEFTRSRTNQKDQKLRHVYYCRLVGESSRRWLMNEFSLSKRHYLGNTTLDVRLAGIIANACLCRAGDLVWDPFLGTGGMVLAASVWGSFGGGSDIDYSLVHGKGSSPKAGQGKRIEGECLRANYKQYGLSSRYLDVVIADAASLCRLLRTPEERLVICANRPITSSVGLFDAIITDPPYGVRERSCRVAGQVKEREPSLVTPEFLEKITHGAKHPVVANNEGLVPVTHDLPHFPCKETYPLQETFMDLLSLSVRLLRPHGRLVFWVPIEKKSFVGSESLPFHPRLRLLSVCEQPLNMRTSRILVVMEKLSSDEEDVYALNANFSQSGNTPRLDCHSNLQNFKGAYFQPKVPENRSS